MSFDVEGAIAEYKLLWKVIRDNPNEIKYRPEEPVSMWEHNFATAFKDQCDNKKIKDDVAVRVFYRTPKLVGRSRALYTQKILWTVTKAIEKYVTSGSVRKISFEIMHEPGFEMARTDFFVVPVRPGVRLVE